MNIKKSLKNILYFLNRNPISKYGLVDTDRSGIVKKFVEKPVLKDWTSGGFMVFNKKIFDYIKPGAWVLLLGKFSIIN